MPVTQSVYNCQCLNCGHVMETAEHCYDLQCPLCGGPMRRMERPGPGRVAQNGEEGESIALPLTMLVFGGILGLGFCMILKKGERG